MVARFLVNAAEQFKPDGTRAIAEFVNSTIAIGNAVRTSLDTPARASDPLVNGESQQEVKTNTTAAYAKPNLPAVVKNPMEIFASSNILWTMACLSPKQFNDPRSYRSSGSDLQHVIFSSAGRYDEQRAKTFFGTPEYYINNFVMTSVIGANEASGNSNAIKFSFDIIEPHSMGLLLQSMQSAAIKAGYLNYLNDTPFLLKMDIQGFNELGQNVSTVQPKFFVMKLISAKFTVSEGGSVYKVEAFPYNHQAFASTINTAFSDVKIFASSTGDVFDVLSSSTGSLMAYLNNNEKKLVAEKMITIPDEYVIQFPLLASDWQSSAGNVRGPKGATSDPNYENNRPAVVASTPVFKTEAQQLSKNDIAKASLGFDQSSGGKPLFRRAGDQYDEKTGVLKREGITINPKSRAFQFGQDQTLTAIITQIILSSDYATKAIDPKFLTAQGFINWFKLDVQIELKDFDELIGEYAKKITYRVVPYLVHQSIFSNNSSAPIGYTELLKDVAKMYQYIYTGQNVDILGFSIEINNLFYSGTNPKPEFNAAQTNTQDQKAAEKLPSSTGTGKGQAPEVAGAQTGRKRNRRDPKLLAGYKGGANEKTVEQNVAEAFQSAFISGNSADMISVDLEILGDPYWMVDSGIANYFGKAVKNTSQITDDGTMNYESGNVYIYISFRTPADVNTLTGLYDFSIAGKESPFGGIYRVISCDNTFADGNWKQKLKCMRMPGPQGPEINKTITGDPASVVSKPDSPAIAIGEKETPKTSIIDSGTAGALVPPANANAAAPGSTTTTTTTTSNRTSTPAGFKYYRDIGQR